MGIKKIDTFKSLRRGHSGRIIELQVSYIDEAGSPWQYTIAGEYNIRKTLHSSFLYSSCIYIEKEALTDSFCIKGAGWGHGVGLCQIGALGMALKGISAADILRHYYPDTKLISIY